MSTITGTYHNGKLKLDEVFSSKKPVRVIVNFLEEVEVACDKPLRLEYFSFAERQELLKDFKGSFSEALIEEGR